MLRILLCAGALLLAGCATSLPANPQSDGPADPHSTESPTAAATQLSLNAPKTVSAVAAQYTCPMHASVVMNHPGKCPICGMTLVPKAGGK